MLFNIMIATNPSLGQPSVTPTITTAVSVVTDRHKSLSHFQELISTDRHKCMGAVQSDTGVRVNAQNVSDIKLLLGDMRKKEQTKKQTNTNKHLQKQKK